jgi:hypothetical protein
MEQVFAFIKIHSCTHMGCILPLSQNEDIPEQYGTRHRAALGLSEVTDAVCLVVSEERAEVSTVVGGQITIWKEPDALAEKLGAWLGGPQIRVPALKQFFKDAFIQNWKTKLGALVIVTIAWLVLAFQQQMKINITAPIRYDNLPTELAVHKGSTTAVSLTLSGRRNSIGELKDQDIYVRVDLINIPAGEHLMKISDKNIDLPRGIKIDGIVPQNINVNLKSLGPDQISK